MDNTAFVLVAIFVIAIIFAVWYVPPRSFNPMQGRATYGARIRPTIDPQTIIRETIPPGREGILYRDTHSMPDLQEKQERFLNIISGGVDVPQVRAFRSTFSYDDGYQAPQALIVNGRAADNHLRDIAGLPVPDLTPMYAEPSLLDGDPTKALIQRPFMRNLRDMRTATQKQRDLMPYIFAKKSDSIIPASFGGA